MTAPAASPDAGSRPDPFASVVGQEAAVGLLRASLAAPVHAYLLVGPHGSGKRALAAAFAAELLSADLDPEAAQRAAALAVEERHPDLRVIERVGPAISAAQADEIVALASRTPVEGDRKVIVLDEFHLVSPQVGPKLLKTIEEPPPGTTFVVLAEQVTADLVTIASRCVRVELGPVADDLVEASLVADGVDPSTAAEAATSAGGDLARARLLAADDRLAIRRRLWADVPSRLDRSGAAVVDAVDELLAAIDDAAEPLRARQAAEVAELQERIEQYGERGSGRRELEERHRRELRRHRTDELRFGLTVLGRRYRDQLATAADPTSLLTSLDAIGSTAQALVRNPNERLQLQALFLRLAPLPVA
ncbi:MAG: hypothetical protein R2726_21530 [Acidimicrobiales bacterium]